jgi:hypothetical protein
MSAPIDWDEDMPSEEPARKPWREAMALSTSARLRAALEANQELAAENERLRARIARQPGFYELTDKGRAATDPTVHQLVYGDDHVHCCGRTVAEVDAAHDHTTLNPHAVTCRPG